MHFGNVECVTQDCFPFPKPRIASLTFETLLFLLTLVKFVDAMRQGWGRRSLMQQFIVDGTWVYTVIFSMCYMFDL